MKVSEFLQGHLKKMASQFDEMHKSCAAQHEQTQNPHDAKMAECFKGLRDHCLESCDGIAAMKSASSDLDKLVPIPGVTSVYARDYVPRAVPRPGSPDLNKGLEAVPHQFRSLVEIEDNLDA